ncbi:MAG: dienelactone hydrolase family protein [Steroidobacteraceae bacterium]|jgi:carboxymethylenebutenolidase
MCDQDSFNDMLEYAQRSSELSRRRFGALSFAGGLAAMLPRIAGAADVVEADVDIKTPDGVADSYFVHPATGKSPGVLMWTDIMGLRPAFKLMGKRLAESGYAVLVPNPFYRSRKAPVLPPGASMQDDATRQTLMGLMGSLTTERQFTDARAFVGFLDSQRVVDHKRKMGTAGYCMGGPLTFRTAATFPDRIGAGASFHGANLASDKPDSPHLLVPMMKAQYLIAIAENDDMKDPAAKTLLREAFASAKLPAEIEVYAGTMHGWCPPDSSVYNEAQAEKAWGRMLNLFKTALA